MAEFIIEGQTKLGGEIEVMGCKNSAAPILAATLLTEESCLIRNVPRISDILRMIEIMKSLGVEVSWEGPHELRVRSANLNLSNLDRKAMKSIRTAILFIAPLLYRFSALDIPEPGGCIIGKRPIDAHLSALSGFGVTVNHEEGLYHFTRKDLSGNTIILPEMSVTATENALMLAAVSAGITTIKLAAVEPQVTHLIEFLKMMGAKIQLIDSHVFRIEGVSALKGASIEVIPDRIEAGTLAVLASATRSELVINPVIPAHMESILTQLTRAGVPWLIDGDRLIVRRPLSLGAFKLKAMPYPGFPTDLQAPFGVLATQATGTSLIHDPLFEGRMGYVHELIKMGADAIVADPHRVIIVGPTPLYGREIKGLDIRAGATLVIAGLLAQGETHIYDAEQVDRGYEDLDGRLRKLGAKIRREA